MKLKQTALAILLTLTTTYSATACCWWDGSSDIQDEFRDGIDVPMLPDPTPWIPRSK